MTQPVFAFPCEYGFKATRSSYGQAIKISATASGATTSNAVQNTTAYEIKTVPIDGDVAIDLDNSLQELKGSFFYSQFYFDTKLFKYRIIDDTWQWEVIGPTANVFTLQVERVYEPTVEFALNYETSQSEIIYKNFLRIATTSGTATPSIISATIKKSQIRTRPVSSIAAASLRQLLQDLSGTVFYSQLLLDSIPKPYRVVDGTWSVNSAGLNGNSIEFELEEVLTLGSDIPITATATNSARTNYGQKIKIATTSGSAMPSGGVVSINEYTIETASVDPGQALGIATSLQNLSGSFFYAKLFDDTLPKKYCLIDDQWSQSFTNQDGVVFQFNIRQVYDPVLEFAIDYGLTQSQTISSSLIRIATTSGSATPSAASRSIKEIQVRTKPMSRTSAATLEANLLALNGASFYSQIYLDSAPRLYRLSPYQWKWTPESENGYVCEFDAIEVMPNTTDIPCKENIGIERTSRIRKVQFGDGYEQVIPDGINTDTVVYSIETLTLSDAQATSLNNTLLARKGDFFYSKLKDEASVAKYRLNGNRWSWNIQGKDANIFTFELRKVYSL